MPVEVGEPLSERELEIVALVAEGLTNREIAERLYISPNTIKVHLRNIFTKTEVSSRTELTTKAIQENWIGIPGVDQTGEETPSENGIPAESPEEAPEPWSWQRWLSFTTAFVFILTVLLLPQIGAQPRAQGADDIFGANPSVYSTLPTETTGKWQELPPQNTRRAGSAVVFLQQLLYVIGGGNADGSLDQVTIYDLVKQEWRSGPPLPSVRAQIQAANIEGTLYVPGGSTSDRHPVDSLYALPPGADEWQTLTPLPQSLDAYALTAWDGKLYLFGGYDGAVYGTASYAYDPETATWKTLAAPSTPRGFGGAATLDGKLYYVGGYDGQRELNTCEVYDPVDDSWGACAPLLQPRGGLGLAAVGAKLYAVGGGWDTNLSFNEQYSPRRDTWAILETPIVGEWRNIGLASSDTALYAVSGWDGRDFLNRTYTLEVLPWRVFIPDARREESTP